MSLKINGLKLLDRTIGSLMCKLSKIIVRPRLESTDIKNILVIRPGGIGDAVLLIPALKELRRTYPHSEICVLCEKRNFGVFNICPYIDEIIRYDKSPWGILAVFSKNFDLVIDTEQWHRLSAVLAFLTRAPVRVGYSTNNRKSLFTNEVEYSHSDYEADSFLRLVSSLTGIEYRFDANLPFLKTDFEIKEGLVEEIEQYSKGKKALIGIFQGATIRERKWGVKKFAELSKRISAENIGVVLLGGESDKKESKEFDILLAGSEYLNLVDKTTLSETIKVISRLDILVSGDTGLMHLAYAVGTPTLSLFGAGIREKWAPKGDNNIVLDKNLHCSPCTRFGYTPTCPIGVKCLGDISVDEVESHLMEFVNNR